VQGIHWEGDKIVQDPVIPAQRTIPVAGKTLYEIDIRQFLTIAGNAVLRGALERMCGGLNDAQRALFLSRGQGSFDLRADVIRDFMRTLQYRQLRDRTVSRASRPLEAWLFPEETLSLGFGDCEDLSLLMASLLDISGISDYCIRVAFGEVVDHYRERRWHHTWVVYKNELGVWEILEPLVHCRNCRQPRQRALAGELEPTPRDVEYIPYYVLNRQHLWRVSNPQSFEVEGVREYLRDREFWNGFNPAFAVGVHLDILDEALKDMPAPERRAVKRLGLWLDLNVIGYDPLDHFDFSYIPEGWERVKKRLGSGKREDFAYAAHGIADFCAHSIYADHAPLEADGSLKPYRPGIPLGSIAHDFKPYAPLPNTDKTTAEAEAQWKDQLISGQWRRFFTGFPDELKEAPDFWRRFCLPDHDQIAVDDPKPGSAHLRYQGAVYKEQFRLRRQAAVRHIREAYESWVPK
jgi:hypothetical protein